MVQPTGDPAQSSGSGSPPASPESHATELRTFLIADVRGYTKYTAEHGDEAAVALVGRFAELVREVVTQREGFLLELRGDEALVVFVSARQALRAAVELQARFAAADGLPRGVGIGLDAGEAIPVGDGYRGTALNLASRLCARAGPGETLASEAVIHLAARVDGIAYVDPRSLRLHGYDDTVRAVFVVPAELAAGRRRASGYGAQAFDSRLAVAGVVGVLAVALIAGALGGGFFGQAGPDAKRSASAEAAASDIAVGVSPSPPSRLPVSLRRRSCRSSPSSMRGPAS